MVQPFQGDSTARFLASEQFRRGNVRLVWMLGKGSDNAPIESTAYHLERAGAKDLW